MATAGNNDVRYQVFLSSTFADLQEERNAVTRALLQMKRCIPAGMEFFGAASQPPWDLIQSVLSVTDYLVLIVGGRYGTPMPNQDISYTEAEYNFARNHGIPVLPFVASHTARLVPAHESTEDQQKRLAFIERVSAEHTRVAWEDPNELASLVTHGLYSEFERNPRPGWRRNPQTTGVPASPASPEDELAAAARYWRSQARSHDFAAPRDLRLRAVTAIDLGWTPSSDTLEFLFFSATYDNQLLREIAKAAAEAGSPTGIETAEYWFSRVVPVRPKFRLGLAAELFGSEHRKALVEAASLVSRTSDLVILDAIAQSRVRDLIENSDKTEGLLTRAQRTDLLDHWQ